MPVRTPIKIGYLPSGFKLSDVDHSLLDVQSPGNSSEVGFRHDTKYDYPDWTVTVTPVAKPTANAGPRNPVLGQVHSIYPEVHRTLGKYVITVATQGAISKAQAERVLASVTLAGQPDSPNDSWSPSRRRCPSCAGDSRPAPSPWCCHGVGDGAFERGGDRAVEAGGREQVGRNVTPSGVVIDSGTDTSTQAIAPLRRRPAEARTLPKLRPPAQSKTAAQSDINA